MLHGISECEEVAPSAFKPVAQCDEFLPAINRDQPAVFETALKLFGLDTKIDNVRIAPDKWVKRLDIGNGRSICFPAINLNRPGFAKFDGDNAWSKISAEEQPVLLEFHEPSNSPSFQAKSRNLLRHCTESEFRDASASLSMTK